MVKGAKMQQNGGISFVKMKKKRKKWRQKVLKLKCCYSVTLAKSAAYSFRLRHCARVIRFAAVSGLKSA